MSNARAEEATRKAKIIPQMPERYDEDWDMALYDMLNKRVYDRIHLAPHFNALYAGRTVAEVEAEVAQQ
jgi:hypothetical protein